MTVELIQCPCGGTPQIMINKTFEAYVICPDCGAKGPEVPFPVEKMIEVDEFVRLLDAQRAQAAAKWNERIAIDDKRLKIYLSCDPGHQEDSMCDECLYLTHPEGLHCPKQEED